jgi:hypothetical protein
MVQRESFNKADPLPFEEFNDLEDVATHEGGFSSAKELGGLALVPKQPETELSFEDQLIRDDAILIATDFFEASGGQDLLPEHYTILLKNNWAQFGIEDVYRVFNEDWQELQSEARLRYEEKRAQLGKGPKTQEKKEHLGQLLKASNPTSYRPQELINNLPEGLDAKDFPTYYLELPTKLIIEGDESLKLLVLNGKDSDNFRTIGELLRDREYLDEIENEERVNAREWSREKHIKFGQWLMKAVPSSDKKEKQINEEILYAARRLGIGPARSTIKFVFGSLSNFYKESGILETHRIGTFEHWSEQDFINYIRRIGGQRRPTRQHFDEMASQDTSNPSGSFMHERFLNDGGFRGLLEKAGYPVIDLWVKDDFINWGVKFMASNQGVTPQALMLDFLSTKKMGPSAHTVIKKFDKKFRNFQEEVRKKYEESGLDIEVDHALSLDDEYRTYREMKRQKDKARHSKS